MHILRSLFAGLVLCLALHEEADGARRCDITSFDQPCQVQGGVYRALVPEGTGPHPTVVYLYGSGGRSTEITRHRYFRQAIVDRGYALLVPAARDVTYVGNVRDTGWSLRNRREPQRDDVTFLRRVLDDAEGRFRIDRNRVLLAGQSDGGFLIWEIACHEPDLAAAYAVHAGSYGGALPERCARPVRFLHAHGRQDDVVPFQGERRNWGRVTSADVRQGLALLARTNRCASETPRAPVPFHGFQRVTWRNCAIGSALDFLIHEGGHGYPGRWMPAVLDWFSSQVAERQPLVQGGSTRFLRPTTENSRFKKIGKGSKSN
ncbi:MAG: hypothetical protein AAGG06_15520 [Pseudomonadota bacterium]